MGDDITAHARLQHRGRNTAVVQTTLTGVIPTGMTFDPVSGMTVTLVSVTGGVASVRVQSAGTDATAPSAVSNLQKSTDATPKVVLSWGAATDNRALAGYEIRRGGVKCAVAKLAVFLVVHFPLHSS